MCLDFCKLPARSPGRLGTGRGLQGSFEMRPPCPGDWNVENTQDEMLEKFKKEPLSMADG